MVFFHSATLPWRMSPTGANGLYFDNQEDVNKMLAAKRPPGWDNGDYMGSGDRALPHGRLFFDIPPEDFFSEALEPGGDPVLLDLIDPPKLVAVLHHIIGQDAVSPTSAPRVPDGPVVVFSV
eukprot:SAG31_NODE_90_length_26410_cov_175.663981_24_plen_122_part_00